MWCFQALLPAFILALSFRRFLTTRSPFESNRTYFENAGIAQSKDQSERSNQVAAVEKYTTTIQQRGTTTLRMVHNRHSTNLIPKKNRHVMNRHHLQTSTEIVPWKVSHFLTPGVASFQICPALQDLCPSSLGGRRGSDLGGVPGALGGPAAAPGRVSWLWGFGKGQGDRGSQSGQGGSCSKLRYPDILW